MKNFPQILGGIPIILAVFTVVYGIFKGVDIGSAFAKGAKRGLSVCLNIFPAILFMLTVITIFRASGAVEAISKFIAPIFEFFGIPIETAQIIMLRPFSGSGALALGREIMGIYGVDSEIGKIAAVMLGASETSIYTIGVYTAYLGIKKYDNLVFCALFADFIAFLSAVWCVRVLF